MPVAFEEVCAALEVAGLDYDDRGGFRKFPAGPARRLARKVYVARPREGNPVRRIDLSGFTFEHAAVRQLSAEDRARNHVGKVLAQIDTMRPRGEILEALADAAKRVGEAPAVVPQSEQDDDDDAGLPLGFAIALPELEAWMETRLGYGNVAAAGWFVGMEEACHCADELPDRLAGGAIEDLDENLRRLECYPDLLDDEPNLQPTWRPLIRAWLVATTGRSPTTAEIRHYQRNQLGRRDADHLLTELLPLPSPGIKRWLYRQLGLEREAYTKEWVPKRIEFLAEQWRGAPTRPRVALAYGKTYWDHYREIFGLGTSSGVPIVAASPDWARGFVVDGGGVVLTYHPVGLGDDASWDAVGAWLRTILQAS